MGEGLHIQPQKLKLLYPFLFIIGFLMSARMVKMKK